jgi:hypothetical protein
MEMPDVQESRQDLQDKLQDHCTKSDVRKAHGALEEKPDPKSPGAVFLAPKWAY